MSNTYQKNRRRAQPDPVAGEVAVPEQVIVSMAEIAGAAREGLLALAVSTGLQVMAAMFEEDVARLCGPGGKHNPGPRRVPARRRGRVGHPGRAPPGRDPAPGAGRGRGRGAAPGQL